MHSNFSTIQDLTTEVQRMEEVKNDYVVPAEAFQMVSPDHVELSGIGEFRLTDLAHGQLASRLDIPRKFYDYIGGVDDLRQQTVEKIMAAKGKKTMVRTLEDNARAIVSDRFKPFDNIMVMQALLPLIAEHAQSGDINIVSQSMTENRLYIQIVFPKVEGEITTGDFIQAGLMITNSEVGLGALKVAALVWRLRCINGMIGQDVVNQYHVGKALGGDPDNYEVFADDTIRADLDAYKLKLRDVFKATVSEATLQDEINRLRTAMELPVEKPKTFIENVTKRFQITEGEGEAVLDNMIEEGQMNKFGLINGVTALAHKTEDRDKQYDFERMGNEVMGLSQNDWSLLNSISQN